MLLARRLWMLDVQPACKVDRDRLKTWECLGGGAVRRRDQSSALASSLAELLVRWSLGNAAVAPLTRHIRLRAIRYRAFSHQWAL